MPTRHPEPTRPSLRSLRVTTKGAPPMKGILAWAIGIPIPIIIILYFADVF